MKTLRLYIIALFLFLVVSCDKYEVIHQGPIDPKDTLLTSIIPVDSTLKEEMFLWSTHNNIYIASKNLDEIKVISPGAHSHISRMNVKGDFSRFALAHDLSSTPISIYDRNNKIVEVIDEPLFDSKIAFGWIDNSAQFYILESDGHINYTQSHSYAVTEISSVIPDFDYAIHANVDRNGIMYIVYKKKLTTFYFIDRIDLKTGIRSGEANVGDEVTNTIKYISIFTNPSDNDYATVYVNHFSSGVPTVTNYIVTPGGIYYGNRSTSYFYTTSDFGAVFLSLSDNKFTSNDDQDSYEYYFATPVEFIKVKDE